MTALARAFRNAAPGKAATAGYNLTNHASQRIVQRIGIAADEATRWANKFIDSAMLAVTQRKNGVLQHIYEKDGWRMVVDEDSRTVVTVLSGVDASFLEPIFDRERRKLQRDVTRKIRSLELEQAHILADIAKHAINRARAKNPNTRALIQRRIDDLQAKVSEKDIEIERQHDRMTRFERATQLFV